MQMTYDAMKRLISAIMPNERMYMPNMRGMLSDSHQDGYARGSSKI